MIRHITFVLILFLTSHARSETTYIWFDLGNVIVDTREGFGNVKYMPGAFEYIEEARSRGHKIGLISNIPEKWGRRGDKQSKIEYLENFIKAGWQDEREFSLALFDEVLIPLFDHERKPAPYLYLQALDIAGELALKSFFQGETRAEVDAAIANGMEGHHVTFVEGAPVFFPLDNL